VESELGSQLAGSHPASSATHSQGFSRDLPDDIGAARRGDAAAAWANSFPGLPISLAAATTCRPQVQEHGNMIENSGGSRMNICIDAGPALSNCSCSP
jgi:hypothetical protein